MMPEEIVRMGRLGSVTIGSGNVFADLSLPNAEHLLADSWRRVAEMNRVERQTDFWVAACRSGLLVAGHGRPGSTWITLSTSDVNARVFGSREDAERFIERQELEGFEARPLSAGLGLTLAGDFLWSNPR